MYPGFGAILLVFGFFTISFWPPEARADTASRCYGAADPVGCFVGRATSKLRQVANPADSADAVGELLYALALTQTRNDRLLDQVRLLVADSAVKPVKQMDLLYAADLYASSIDPAAEQPFALAVSRFAALERELKGNELVELYVGACAIMAWDGPFRERWVAFAQSTCTPEKLGALQGEGVAHRALVVAMMPAAMTFAESRDGFVASADTALTWLSAAEKLAAKSKKNDDKDFVDFIGVLMHTMNSFCLDMFDQPDASDGEIDRSLKVLRRMEKRTGISGKSTVLRRQVVESLFDTGREIEAKKLLRQMLAHVDADKDGKKIRFSEQIAILLLAARLAYEEQTDQEQTDVPDGSIRM